MIQTEKKDNNNLKNWKKSHLIIIDVRSGCEVPRHAPQKPVQNLMGQWAKRGKK